MGAMIGWELPSMDVDEFRAEFFYLLGRRERIRTSDPFVPNEVRYQAALHADGLILACASPIVSRISKMFVRPKTWPGPTWPVCNQIQECL